MTPSITIGIPVYNGMPWICETVESIRQQTCSDFAVLIIDDGSTDGSAEYLQSLRDPRFRVIRQENRGITATLNRMLTETESPWLMRQDADDIAFPERVARTLEYIQRYPNAGLLFSHACHYQNNRTFGRLLTTEGSPEVLHRLTISGYLPAICHSTVVLNIAKTRELGGYRFDLNVEEYDIFWRMALAHDLRLIPETLVGYRMRNGSISARNMRSQASAILYIQYLLLSALSGVDPQPYPSVKECLDTIIDRRALDYRLHMREALTALGALRFSAMIAGAVRGVASSPELFVRRVLYQMGKQIGQPQTVHVGVAPEKLLARAKELWPGEKAEPRISSYMQPLSARAVRSHFVGS